MDFQHITECHKVTKPWGHEIWLQAGSDVYPFALKELLLKSGNMTSLQVHQFKSETIKIVSGTGKIVYWDWEFDCERYLNGGYTEAEISSIKQNLISKDVSAGSVFSTPPNTIHRMIAEEDLIYIEASTTQLDDVIRLEDSSNRPHGKIESEHAK